MKAILVTILAASGLVACASAPAPDAATAVSQNLQPDGAASLNGGTQTGSRLGRSAGDRMLRSVGNQSYRDDNQVRSLGNEIGARSN